MRNEAFGRLLYLIVNTCFAKVRGNSTFCFRYLKTISGRPCGGDWAAHPFCRYTHAHYSARQLIPHCMSASRRNSQWLRTIRRTVASVQGHKQFPEHGCYTRRCSEHGSCNEHRGHGQCAQRISLGPKYPSQVRSFFLLLLQLSLIFSFLQKRVRAPPPGQSPSFTRSRISI